MKIFGFKPALAMLTFSVIALVSFQSPSQAQVNKKLLSDVIKSCNRDMNPEYFEGMGIPRKYYDRGTNYELNDLLDNSVLGQRRNCILYRYRHMSLIGKMNWLPYSGDILPKYSASVAISQIMLKGGADRERIIECLSSKDINSENCNWISSLRLRYGNDSLYREYGFMYIVNYLSDTGTGEAFLMYVCPRCVVAHDESSDVEMKRGFINWFLSLDVSKRREIVNALAFGSSLNQEVKNESWRALQAYDDALKKIEQDDKEQRRRNLLGQ